MLTQLPLITVTSHQKLPLEHSPNIMKFVRAIVCPKFKEGMLHCMTQTFEHSPSDERSQQLRTVLQKNLICKGPTAFDGQQKIIFADLNSITMLAWVLHHGATSSISLEQHSMDAAPVGDYVSLQMSPLCDFWLASAIGRGKTIEVGVDLHTLAEWNLNDLHVQRCQMRAEDDLSYLDAEIAQVKSNLQMLQSYRTSVLLI